MKYLVPFHSLIIDADSADEAFRIAVHCQAVVAFSQVSEATEHEQQIQSETYRV